MTGITPPSVYTKRVYRLSCYYIDNCVVKINHRACNDLVPKPFQTYVMLSAYNPGGKRYTSGWNQRQMEILWRMVYRFKPRPGKGQFKRWSEPLIMIESPLPRALKLARLFRQNAVVVIMGHKKARLHYLA